MAPRTNPLAGRRPRYLDQYAHTLVGAYRVEQIRREVESEQQRVDYVDSLVNQARQTAASLEASLQAQPPASLEAATALLKEQYDAQNQARQRRAGEDLAFQRATGLTAEEKAALTPTGRKTKEQVAAEAERIIADPKTSAEKAAATLSQARSALGADYAGIGRLEAALGAPQRVQGARAQPRGARALTPEEAARQETLNQLFESTYFAGPSGIVGGYAGKAVADARATTKAPPGTSFTTAEDAFAAAIRSLENGTVEREDFASDEDFAYANEVYKEAAAAKAFRNDQRTAFEPAVLKARQEVAKLEKQRAQLIGTTYEDPAQEAMRRELIARGYKVYDPSSAEGWKNAYIKLQKNPDYNLYLKAHELVDKAISSGERIEFQDRAQQLAIQYTSLRQRKGEPLSIEDLRRQLDKAGYSGKLADEAIALTMAYWEVGGPEQASRLGQVKTEREQAKAAEETRRTSDQKRVAEADAQIEAARTARARAEEGVARNAPPAPPPAPAPLPRAPSPTMDALKAQRAELEARARAEAGTELGGLLSGSKGEVLPPTPAAPLPAGAQGLLDAMGQGAAQLDGAPLAKAPAKTSSPRQAVAPAPARPAAAPAPAPAPAPAAPRPVADLQTLAQKAAQARLAGDISRAVLIEAQIDAMRKRAPAPAAAPAAAPAPASAAPAKKPVSQMTDEELEALIEGGR